MTVAAKTIVGLRNVIHELGFEQGKKRVHHDSATCTEWSNFAAGKHFRKRKNIDVRHNYVMFPVEDGIIVLISTRTTDTMAYFFTKSSHSVELSRAVSNAKGFHSSRL